MDPNSFNPDQNPFEAILAQKSAAGGPPPAQNMPPQAMMAGMARAGGMGAGKPPMGQQMGPEMMVPDELQPGKTGDNTKPLLMAIQALHNYIAASTDQATIRLVRNLISALTQLVARDQQAGSELAEQQMSQMQQGGMGQEIED